MYSLTDVQHEIAAKIEWLKNNNGPVLHPDWIAQAIMSEHDKLEGEDADFHLCCSRAQVRNEVRQQLNRFKPKEEATSPQLVMEGFERLQHYYLVTRDKEQVAVRVDAMTDEEIEAKATEQESMGRGCFQHADELRRYKELRRERKLELHLAPMPATAELRA